MTFAINGVDITPYIAFGGLKWQRADVDGANAGRTLDGTMVRDRRAIKTRWDVTCRPLTASELSTILTLIQPEFVTLQYLNPVTNITATDQFYANNFPVQFSMITKGGVEYWTGLTFPLIQK